MDPAGTMEIVQRASTSVIDTGGAIGALALLMVGGILFQARMADARSRETNRELLRQSEVQYTALLAVTEKCIAAFNRLARAFEGRPCLRADKTIGAAWDEG